MNSDKMCESSQSSSGLNESWVELNLSGMANKGSGLSTPSYEKLLVEAQKESGMTSRNSSGHNSAKALHSPPLSAASSTPSEELRRSPIEIPHEQLQEFIRDWSSRPEIIPPSDYGMKLERPIKRHPLSVRNTRVMKESWLSSENLPTLMITHAASFVVGASLVCWYLNKSAGGTFSG